MKGALSMFKVHVNDGSKPVPPDDICYIVAKEGIFLKKRMGVMESIAPVQNISILESVEKMAKMHIKKIPGGQFARVLAFFREVYALYHGEAIVLLFYDQEKKVYKIIPPTQKVTSASCDYDKGITINNMQMIGTIHSHASMSAFHSGTDDSDEKHFDGLHITIGNIPDEEVSISASIVANGHRFKVPPEDYIERLQLTKDVDEVEEKPLRRVFKIVNGKVEEDTVASSRYTYTWKRYDKRYTINVSDKYHKVIPEWMGMVERGTFTHYNHFYDMYGYGRNPHAPYNQNFPTQHYNPHLWRQWRPTTQSQIPFQPQQTGGNPLNVGPAATIKPVVFPEHELDLGNCNSTIPCQTCKFREYKFMAEADGLDDNDVYKCKKCDTTIIDEFDTDPICPKCKTDEFLLLIDTETLPSHYNTEFEEVGTSQPDPSFTTCKLCGNAFHVFESDMKCPLCYTTVQIDDVSYSKEDEYIRQTIKDMGGYLGEDTEEINKIALEEAARQDEWLERIPDPNEVSIPLPEKMSVGTRSNRSLISMFKQIFGKERG